MSKELTFFKTGIIKGLSLGMKYQEVKEMLGDELFINDETENIRIISDDSGIEYTFKDDVLMMISLKLINGYSITELIELTLLEDIKWSFRSDLTFSNQVCMELESKVSLIFRYDKGIGVCLLKAFISGIKGDG